MKTWWSDLEVVLKSIRKEMKLVVKKWKQVVNEEDDENNDDKMILEISFNNNVKRE